MAPAIISTPDTGRWVAMCTAMTVPRENPADTNPSGRPATPARARRISSACPSSSSAWAIAGA